MLDFADEQPPSPSLEDLLEEDGEQIALVITEDGGVPRICAYSQIHDPELSIPAIYLSACDELPKMAEVFFTRTNPESEPISPASASPSTSREPRTLREDTPRTPSNPANARAAPPSEDTTRATFAQSAAAQPAATTESRYSQLLHDPNNTFAFTYSSNGTTYVVSPRRIPTNDLLWKSDVRCQRRPKHFTQRAQTKRLRRVGCTQGPGSIKRRGSERGKTYSTGEKRRRDYQNMNGAALR
ncbi:hypothetical protein NUW54_g6058 [Trametes sanguinea]|uniref:Uncharacterized protein n=1 Tax=Trametes sanguinea TaxID=158606 RepID=A0ACC1PVW0_9APHY|nr:hypothetical protein NUW54_g6058 [Trametes sanguinea]